MTEQSQSVPQLALVGPANEVKASLLQAAHACAARAALQPYSSRFTGCTLSYLQPPQFFVSGPAISSSSEFMLELPEGASPSRPSWNFVRGFTLSSSLSCRDMPLSVHCTEP